EHTVHTRGVEGSNPPLATQESSKNFVFTRFLGLSFLLAALNHFYLPLSIITKVQSLLDYQNFALFLLKSQ
ncbi:MAG: hypothetical protein NC400_05295, partial [Clostridium sp.]|nr:hypothetical protein [Clostridium sp.]